ncbi:MAG: glycosyltransferase [Chitinophagales bacterium]
MKIGFDAKRAFFNNTGLGNYSRTLIKSLVKYYPDNQYTLYSPKSIEGSPFAEMQNFKNIEVKTPQTRFQKLLGGSLWRSLQLGNPIKDDQLDIYHGLSHELPRNIHRSRPQTKSIVTIHDLIFLRYPELYSKVDTLIYRQKWKHACQQADKVIAISEQTKSDTIEFLGIEANKIEVVYQSCHPVFTTTMMPFSYSMDSSNKTILKFPTICPKNTFSMSVLSPNAKTYSPSSKPSTP